jgi:hypothetical protein
LTHLSNLQLFCETIVRKYGDPGRATEEQKAREFRDVFLSKFRLNFKTLGAVAASCGLTLDGLEDDRMPRNLRGYHEVYGNKKYIYFRKDDTLSGAMNTILHETREIMENIFVEMHPDYEPLRTSARHIAANRFASAVLLPREEFTARVYETGLDVIELGKLYSKSYSQVLLRIGEVLQGKLFFYAALYEPGIEEESPWRVTYRTGGVNNEDPDANVHGLNEFFPKKGGEVVPGSLVDMTIKEGRPHIAERITLLDEMDDEGLVAIANPLMIKDRAAKVVFMALMMQNSSLLEPQVNRVNPVVVEGFHRHL